MEMIPIVAKNLDDYFPKLLKEFNETNNKINKYFKNIHNNQEKIVKTLHKVYLNINDLGRSVGLKIPPKIDFKDKEKEEEEETKKFLNYRELKNIFNNICEDTNNEMLISMLASLNSIKSIDKKPKTSICNSDLFKFTKIKRDTNLLEYYDFVKQLKKRNNNLKVPNNNILKQKSIKSNASLKNLVDSTSNEVKSPSKQKQKQKTLKHNRTEKNLEIINENEEASSLVWGSFNRMPNEFGHRQSSLNLRAPKESVELPQFLISSINGKDQFFKLPFTDAKSSCSFKKIEITNSANNNEEEKGKSHRFSKKKQNFVIKNEILE